jgi:hypothetical protein
LINLSTEISLNLVDFPLARSAFIKVKPPFSTSV